ncbi:hypothetical protein B0H14DRAFT_276530 [Mycena olivaceomarginata]|nr:hypothetical protein B0H14DRAFT_276530 [Mycena olivaceomarginata]
MTRVSCFAQLLVLFGLGCHAPLLGQVSLYKINDTCCPRRAVAAKGAALGVGGFSRLFWHLWGCNPAHTGPGGPYIVVAILENWALMVAEYCCAS